MQLEVDAAKADVKKRDTCITSVATVSAAEQDKQFAVGSPRADSQGVPTVGEDEEARKCLLLLT